MIGCGSRYTTSRLLEPIGYVSLNEFERAYYGPPDGPSRPGGTQVMTSPGEPGAVQCLAALVRCRLLGRQVLYVEHEPLYRVTDQLPNVVVPQFRFVVEDGL